MGGILSTMAQPHAPGFQRNVEMVRRHRVDGLGVSEIAHLFGVSRQTVYNVTRAYETEGLAGLVPGKSGPRDGFKCTAEIVDYLVRCRRRSPEMNVNELARRVADVFHVEVHPNTIRYALAKRTAPPSRARKRQAARTAA